jgi:hypothetical protein
MTQNKKLKVGKPKVGKKEASLALLLISVAASGCSATSKNLASGPTPPLAANAIPGVGSTSIPTADAVVARAELGLQGTANHFSGNCQTGYNQVKPNLNKNSNPTAANGFDAVGPFFHACCVDAIIGNSNNMQNSKIWNINIAAGTTVSSQKPALIAAGMKILDAHLAGQATANAATFTPIFSSLVDNHAAASSTVVQAFASVCVAATHAGVMMKGF